MALIISAPKDKIQAVVQLPSSKSISNRVLIIRSLCKEHFNIQNLSQGNDTQTLQYALDNINKMSSFNVGDAGTAMRFLTALFSVIPGKRILKGSARMHQRPIGPLVDSLQMLGASINCLGKSGFPPLKITGKELDGGTINLKSDKSSQFASAMMMIAPALKKGLDLHLSAKVVSHPYIKMTQSVMSNFHVTADVTKDNIHINPQVYIPSDYQIEPDWSAAAFWFEIVALSEEANILIPRLKKNSIQGDKVIEQIMNSFGVSTDFTNQGIKIKKIAIKPQKKSRFDFTSFPDLVQPVAVCCAALGIDADFKGIETLRIKETDRIKALETELKKINVRTKSSAGTLSLNCQDTDTRISSVSFKCYGDHRMAMALAPLAIKYNTVRIDDEKVVDKSFPTYWQELKKAGFKIKTPLKI